MRYKFMFTRTLFIIIYLCFVKQIVTGQDNKGYYYNIVATMVRMDYFGTYYNFPCIAGQNYPNEATVTFSPGSNPVVYRENFVNNYLYMYNLVYNCASTQLPIVNMGVCNYTFSKQIEKTSFLYSGVWGICTDGCTCSPDQPCTEGTCFSSHQHDEPYDQGPVLYAFLDYEIRPASSIIDLDQTVGNGGNMKIVLAPKDKDCLFDYTNIYYNYQIKPRNGGTWEDRSGYFRKGTNYLSTAAILGSHSSDWVGQELLIRLYSNDYEKYESLPRSFIILPQLEVTSAQVSSPLKCHGDENAEFTFTLGNILIPHDTLLDGKPLFFRVDVTKYSRFPGNCGVKKLVINGKEHCYMGKVSYLEFDIVSNKTITLKNESLRDTLGGNTISSFMGPGIYQIDIVPPPEFSTIKFQYIDTIIDPLQFTASLDFVNKWNGYNLGYCDTDVKMSYSGITNGVTSWKVLLTDNSLVQDLSSNTNGTFLLNYTTYKDATVKIIDKNNCEAQFPDLNKTFSLNFNKPSAEVLFTPDIQAITHVKCFNESTGEIPFTVAGGVGGYTYTISGIGTKVPVDGKFTGIPAGNYTITARDLSSCSSIVNDILINQPISLPSLAKVNYTGPTCNGYTDGQISSVEINGGTSPYFYSIDGGAAWKDASSYTSGYSGNENITVRTRDYNSCAAGETLISIPAAPGKLFARGLSTTSSCPEATNGSLNIAPHGGTPDNGLYDFLVSGDSKKLSEYSKTGLMAGNYSIKVTDKNGCFVDSIITVTADTDELSFTATTSPVSCASISDGLITINVTPASRTEYPLTYSDGTNSEKSSENTYTFLSHGLGSYNIQVFDVNGCNPALQVKQVEETSTPLELTVNSFNNPPCPGKKGDIRINRLHGSPKYTLSVLKDGSPFKTIVGFNATDTLFTGLEEGSYSFEVNDIKTCNSVATQTLVTGISPVQFQVITNNPQSCNGVNNGYAKIRAISNVPIDTVFHAINNFVKGDSIELINKPAGTYRLRAVDASGCKGYEDILITNIGNEPSLIPVKIDSVACLTSTNGALNVIARQKTNAAPYTFKYSSLNKTDSIITLDSTFTFPNLSNTNYTFSVRDKDGCVSFDKELEIPLFKYPLVKVGITHWDSTSCRDATDGGVKVAAFTDKPQSLYKYYLFKEDVLSDSAHIDTASFKGLTAQNKYRIKIVDNYQCSYLSNEFYPKIKTDSLFIQQNKLFNASCIGLNDGKAIFNLLNGKPFDNGFKFIVKNSETNVLKDSFYTVEAQVPLNGYGKGKYIAKVYDKTGCSATNEFEIIEPKELDIYGEVINVADKGLAQGVVLSHVANGNLKYEYQWLRVYATDSLIVAGTTPLVKNGSDTILQLSNVKAGQYKLMVRDTAHCNNGAWLEKIFSIAEPQYKLQLNYVANQVKCYGEQNGSIVLQASGGWGKYKYSLDSVSFLPNNIFDQLSAGNYKAYLTDSAGVVRSSVITVSEPIAPLSASLLNTVDTRCFDSSDGEINISALGGTAPYFISLDSITWFKGTTFNKAGYGVHKVFVKDTMSCQTILTQMAEIKRPPAILLSQSTITSATCNVADGSIIVKAGGGTPGFMYSWKGPNNQTITGNDTVKNLASGVYNLFVTDNNLCIDTFILVVSDNTDLTISPLNITSVTCNGFADGSATVTASLGKPGYTFQWLNGPSGNTISNQPSGNYIVWVTDIAGCKKFDTIFISSPDPISLTRRVSNPFCWGREDGFINVEAAGGSGSGYSYNWSNGVTSNNLQNLYPGKFSLRVSDSKNCFNDFSFTLRYQMGIKPNLGPDVLLCSGNSYQLFAGNYQEYSWYHGNNVIPDNYGASLTISDTGYYSVIVRNEIFCKGSDTMHFSVSPNPENAELLVASQAMVGDTLVLIETSWPMPDSIKWFMPEKTVVIEKGAYYRHVVVKDTGEFEFRLISYRMDCFDMISRTVKIIPRNKTNQNKSIRESLIKLYKLYPNPNNGTFSVDIQLSRNADAILRLVNLSTGVTMDYRQLKGFDKYTERYAKKLPAGMYVLYLQAGSESRTVNVIVL